MTVYAGIDPLSGKRLYLNDTAPTEAAAKKLRRRLVSQVEERRHGRTRATMSTAVESWLRTHDAEKSTLDGYRGYIERNIDPALGDVPLASITVRLLEEFYGELRRCRMRCRDGEPAVDHQTGLTHECRTDRGWVTAFPTRRPERARWTR